MRSFCDGMTGTSVEPLVVASRTIAGEFPRRGSSEVGDREQPLLQDGCPTHRSDLAVDLCSVGGLLGRHVVLGRSRGLAVGGEGVAELVEGAAGVVEGVRWAEISFLSVKPVGVFDHDAVEALAVSHARSSLRSAVQFPRPAPTSGPVGPATLGWALAETDEPTWSIR